MQFWSPDGFEFSDRHGRTRSLFGCSTIGIFEFNERLTEIQSVLDEALETETWQEIYLRNSRFQFLVQRCLKLNGIKPKWVTLGQVETLLFRRPSSEGWEVGYLVELNRPKNSGGTQATEGSATLEEVIAAIATHTATLTEAFELAAQVPANQLQAVQKARNEQAKEQIPEAKAKKQQRRSRDQLAKMRELAVTNGNNPT
jgi:hypothetical protein